MSLSLSLCYKLHGKHVTPVSPLKQVIKLRNNDISYKFFTNYTYVVLDKIIKLV